MHQQDSYRKHCGKRRRCSQRAISPFPTMFSTQSDNVSQFVHIFDIKSLLAAEFEGPKIGILGKGFNTVFREDVLSEHTSNYLVSMYFKVIID